MNRIIIMGGLLLFVAGATATQISARVGLQRTDLSRHDLSIEGREVIQIERRVASFFQRLYRRSA